jgi:hypothetical protein
MLRDVSPGPRGESAAAVPILRLNRQRLLGNEFAAEGAGVDGDLDLCFERLAVQLQCFGDIPRISAVAASTILHLAARKRRAVWCGDGNHGRYNAAILPEVAIF